MYNSVDTGDIEFVVTGPLSERACLHAPGLPHGDLPGDHPGEEHEPGDNIYLHTI